MGDTPGSRPQLALAGGEGAPEPPETWCPEWSLGGPAVMTTAGPLPPPSPHPGAAAGVNCRNSVDPTRKQVQGRGRTTPPQGWLSPGRWAPESLSPAPPWREGHAVRSSGSRCPAHKPWGDYTHTHTLSLLSRDQAGRQNQAAGFEKKHIPGGPQEHKQARGSHGSRASPGHPPSWPRAFLGLQPGRESFLQFRLLFLPVPQACQNFWGPEPLLSPDEAKTDLGRQPHWLGRCTPTPPILTLLLPHPITQALGEQDCRPEGQTPCPTQTQLGTKRRQRQLLPPVLPRPVQTFPNTHDEFLLNFLVNCTSNARIHLQ